MSEVRRKLAPGRVCLKVAVLFALCCSVPPVRAAAQTLSVLAGTVSDARGLPIEGARLTVVGDSPLNRRAATTDAAGAYRVPALPPGVYRLAVAHEGFSTRTLVVEVALNSTVRVDVTLEVGQLREVVTVGLDEPALEAEAVSAGRVVTPREIKGTPLSGRNYLDLLQLVPGVALNRQADRGSDSAVPVLGERAGNTGFLIDGFSNQDSFYGGAAAQFNQDTIAEFQVLTTGYKAEFGYASGGIVNAVSKSGTDDMHGALSLFYRNRALDASNLGDTRVPALSRGDYSLATGGAVVKDRVFFYGSAERIAERRQLNFTFPARTPQLLKDFESRFDRPYRDYETRAFLKLEEPFGRHRLTQQVNWTNAHLSDFLPLSKATNLPSSRQNVGARTLTLGASDTALLGGQRAPLVLTLRGQYRDEPLTVGPSHPEAGPETAFEMFSDSAAGKFFGDLGQVVFGSSLTTSRLRQKNFSLDASLARYGRRHGLKAGWDFTRMKVDGVEASLLFNQLFATLSDFAAFGPTASGLFTLRTRGGNTPADNLIRLHNTHHGLFVQDDWKPAGDLSLSLGLRWDYDTRFPSTNDFSPRLGFAWRVGSKFVARGSWGVFYDRFRLELARDIPSLGGANVSNVQPVSYPRLFYGVPTIAPIVFGLCLSPSLTDAQVAAGGAACPLGPLPLIGVDRLNGVVAPGHAPVPANSVVTAGSVESLTGLTPQQFADQASRAVGRAPGFFFWGPFGALTHAGSPATAFPVTLDPRFRTPHTSSLSLGVEREFGRRLTLEATFYYKRIEDIVGMRLTNLPVEARLPGGQRHFEPPVTQQEVRGFGPWFRGRYIAMSFGLTRRFGGRGTLNVSYTYARARDNARCANLVTGLVVCAPSDSFVGVPPVVTDPTTGRSNESASFTASNGNPVPRAGVFYNGPDMDWGPSDLALDHTFLAHGSVELPWRTTLSAVLRAQSGFHFSRQAAVPVDVDGDLNFNDIDHAAGRNSFTAPPLVNLDLRVSREFKLGERFTLSPLVEFFNVLNRRNPAAVEAGAARPTPFGQPLQVLPGREGQLGLRVEF